MPSSASCVVLNVNNRDATRYLIGRWLRRSGFQLLEARSGVEALRFDRFATRRVVEGHAGTARVESEIDQGSTFVVELPRSPSPLKSSRNGPMTVQHRILIVDDDPDIRETLSEVLGDEGYSVAAASNGQEALALLSQGPLPALILLDVMMPVMDGRQFREQQLRVPEFASIPVVILSAHSNMHEIEQRTRPAAMLKKPLRLSDLLTALQRILEESGAGDGQVKSRP